MIESTETAKPKINKPCAFITLHNPTFFEGVRMNKDPTNYVLWYEKENPMRWGVTIKKFDKKSQFKSQHEWKLTWVYNDLEELLVPTNSSAEFADCIGREATLSLNDIRLKYLEKKK